MSYIKNPSIRKFISLTVPIILVPVIVIFSAYFFRDKYYSFIILSLVCLSLLVFISGIENKKNCTRRLVLCSAFIALASVGGAICSPIPGVNPITAITVLSALYLGAESGFMIGAFSALISNLFNGIGMWTPFQMFAWGIIGFIAGYISKILINKRIIISIFCFISGFLYSFIMDLWTVVWAYNSFDFLEYKAAIYTALPYSIIYATSNFIFALLLAKPFSEKLGRIKIKYGI